MVSRVNTPNLSAAVGIHSGTAMGDRRKSGECLVSENASLESIEVSVVVDLFIVLNLWLKRSSLVIKMTINLNICRVRR